MKRPLFILIILTFVLAANAQTDVWTTQASGFSAPNRGIRYIDAVDSNVVWAIAFDGSPSGGGPCQDFTRTVDGGATWTPGHIIGVPYQDLAMISAVDENFAWVAAFPSQTSTVGMGIWRSHNGGISWIHQTTAAFSNTNSFPNCVHFFNLNEGWCMGDPVNGEFEIYTTTDGGVNWVAVPASQIANPLVNEYGVIGFTCSVGDTSWFGTNSGRIFRSIDKGNNWTVSGIPVWSSTNITPVFKDAMNGIIQDRNPSSTGSLAGTSDGGDTWMMFDSTLTTFTTDLRYVPETPGTYVATGSVTDASGVKYSFDGGHTWLEMPDTDGIQFLAEDWINPHTGWAGGFNTNATTGGMYKFADNLINAIPDFVSPDTAVAMNGYANFTNLTQGATSCLWTFQGGIPGTSTLASPPPVQYTTHGTYDVSLTVSNTFTPSVTLTKPAYIRVGGVGIPEGSKANVDIHADISGSFLIVKSDIIIREISIYNLTGQIIMTQKVNNTEISVNTGGYNQGIYAISLTFNDGIYNKKVYIR